jgi:hypothetical protein
LASAQKNLVQVDRELERVQSRTVELKQTARLVLTITASVLTLHGFNKVA